MLVSKWCIELLCTNMMYTEFHYHVTAHKFLYRLFYCHNLYPVILCVCVCFFLKLVWKQMWQGGVVWVGQLQFDFMQVPIGSRGTELNSTRVAKRSKSFELLIFFGWTAKCDNIALLVLLPSANCVLWLAVVFCSLNQASWEVEVTV